MVWKKQKDNSTNVVWGLSGQPTTRVNVRRNANTGNWQVFVTDGDIEREDLGTENTKSEAINEARSWMRSHPNG